jgi:hypothetical protein
MTLIYEDLVKENKVAFLARIQQIAAGLNINPNWLMAVIYIESRFDPKAVNKQAGDSKLGKTDFELALTRGVGLIQFMPNTCKAWGLNGQDIYNMSNLKQLDYVEKYLSNYRGKMKSFVDVYFCVFRPREVGEYLDFVCGSLGSDELIKKIAKQNSGLDLDKNEQITKREVQTKILYAIDEKYHPLLTV